MSFFFTYVQLIFLPILPLLAFWLIHSMSKMSMKRISLSTYITVFIFDFVVQSGNRVLVRSAISL